MDTISCCPQTAAGKEKLRSGPHSNVSFLLARSVICQHMPYFNSSWSLRKLGRAAMADSIRKVLVKSCSAAGAAFFLEKRVCLLIPFLIRTHVRGIGGQSTHQ